MDPFEVRMQFIVLLQRLSASQQSIQRVVSYAVKHFSACGEDIWECILEDCEKGSINARINILYFLDSLCERCLLIKSHQRSQPHPHRSGTSSSSAIHPGAAAEKQNNNLYVDFVTRDLVKIIEYVVPEGRQGLPNLVSTRQILENWRTKRVLDPQKIDEALSILNERSQLPPPSTTEPDDASTNPSSKSKSKDSSPHNMSKNDVFKRIEEDRERHKRLRERRWVQPISYASSSFNPKHMPLASFLPLTTTSKTSAGQDQAAPEFPEEELPVDIEFENEWETTSDWNEDDEEVVAEERELCFPREGEEPMDLS
ncbi:hypothetical protein CC1G_04629 [Coprinopsis cinerea okayama7|uniref:CID domain-containing protein n=1 Tax=Coprinopsis cinerea (strain Okayama-7 / 130 / ATCC MYA-4618 / FGSC 9003) TaxID=240176 RepID=A8N4W9_COPC7|nr:hypothetical protein CC1G_04629 [Coprinopsis cinerea okayama7\|eukprot:XP_001829940.2 hypothetical protein CC1G_04629 [Coprinopsis cinerea okayama7\